MPGFRPHLGAQRRCRAALVLTTPSHETMPLDALSVSIWGDGTGGSSHYGPVVPPPALSVTVIVYGRIPARQNRSSGAYIDTITATINF